MSAPTPLGPPILCAESVIRSAPSALISQEIRPAAWTASTCRRPPASCTSARRFGNRLNTPVSLLASMRETSGRRRPWRSALRKRREIDDAIRRRPEFSRPLRRQIARPPAPTDARSPRPATRVAATAGDSASILASVPPEVNTTLRGSAPTSAATCSRAVPRSAAPRGPRAWTDDGLPQTSSAATTAARACGRSGAVAFQSR